MYAEEYNQKKIKVLSVIQDKNYKPLKQKELAYLLQVSTEDKEEFRRILMELTEEGKILLTKKGKYKRLDEFTKIGYFIGNSKGFGFVSVEGEEQDYFIHESDLGGAMHKDKVLFKIIAAPHGKRKEGTIIKILERGYDTVVGTFQNNRNFGFVIPDNLKLNQDIFISKKNTLGAVDGHKVVVKLTEYGREEKGPEGKVVEILGHINDPGTDILSIVRAYELPMEFDEEIKKYVKHIPQEVSAEEIKGRLDLRHLQTVTIDGEDAKDLDDAITIEKTEKGYRLGVHIADVTHYVTENSVLDKEALNRGTSVYLIDRVIPMLPHKLSNGICSLNQGADRLTLSCLMDIDAKGKVTSYQVAETLINVDKRMNYHDVFHVLEEKENAPVEEYKDFIAMLKLMEELSGILRKRRRKRGSIDFDFQESKIILTKAGEPVDIIPYERNMATDIIEDFMLLANETIAEDYFWQEIPFEYRNHEAPDPEKVEKLGVMIQNFGYYFKASTETIHPKEFQKLLEKVEGSDEEAFISRLTLRTMKQAKYGASCTGHFGLCAKYYCHFTSPIRRYPDLQIHRIIKENLNGMLSEKRILHYENILPQVSDSNSRNERRAEEAEREVEKLKKVQFMEKHIGETFTGVISGINTYGIYVELPNTVEGMIHVTELLDDYYIYDETKYAMIGKDTGKEFTLGQAMKIVVSGVNQAMRTIDFIPFENLEENEYGE